MRFVAFISPIQVGFPLDAQRGALPPGSDANTLSRVAHEPSKHQEGIEARQGGMKQHAQRPSRNRRDEATCAEAIKKPAG